MLAAFEHHFGEYPFKKDGYKLIEAPYSGMEHQTAVTYGNHFANGYLERDWTGVGISPRFDFIVIHESAHEWFGNSVSAADALFLNTLRNVVNDDKKWFQLIHD